MRVEKFMDKAEREIFAAAMEARIRQCPFETADEVASRAWAMVLEYRSRCHANNGGPTGEEAVAEAWEWLEASAGREWASADEVAADAGPTEADLSGEVVHE